MMKPWFDIAQRKFDKHWVVWERMKDPMYAHVRFPTGVEIPRAWVMVFVSEERKNCVIYVKERLDNFDKEFRK
jgi:hypothetical protein